MKIIFLSLFVLLTSCAFIFSGNKQRKEQTEIIRLISEKNAEFAKCAQKAKIFKHFEANRVPVTIFLEINQKGALEKFKLDDKTYPGAFTDCVFDVVELIQFPKNESFDLVKVEQPFVFTAKN